MSVDEEKKQSCGGGTKDAWCTVDIDKLNTLNTTNSSTDKEVDLLLCRICQCAESDTRGDAALSFLNILPPSHDISSTIVEGESTNKVPKKDVELDTINANNSNGREPGFVEFISPEGEVFLCSTDIESGSYYQQGTLINLGCSCKNELALAHYACALKWFISHGSTICEICGSVSKNVRPTDFKKVLASLKKYDAARETTVMGEITQVHAEANSDVDPDALAAVRRLSLSEVSMWFNPQNSSIIVSHENVDRSSNVPPENGVMVESPTSKWAVECTGILVATGLLTVTLAWLISPHVGKKTAKNGLHILLGGVCALTVVIFLRFVILSRFKYGPAHYWAILFVFWFLVFGIWASRTHGHHLNVKVMSERNICHEKDVLLVISAWWYSK